MSNHVCILAAHPQIVGQYLFLRDADGTHRLPIGKSEHGETLTEAAARVFFQETGLAALDLRPLEILTAANQSVLLFACINVAGTISLSDRGVCCWTEKSEIAPGFRTVLAVYEHWMMNRA